MSGLDGRSARRDAVGSGRKETRPKGGSVTKKRSKIQQNSPSCGTPRDKSCVCFCRLIALLRVLVSLSEDKHEQDAHKTSTSPSHRVSGHRKGAHESEGGRQSEGSLAGSLEVKIFLFCSNRMPSAHGEKTPVKIVQSGSCINPPPCPPRQHRSV